MSREEPDERADEGTSSGFLKDLAVYGKLGTADNVSSKNWRGMKFQIRSLRLEKYMQDAHAQFGVSRACREQKHDNCRGCKDACHAKRA